MNYLAFLFAHFIGAAVTKSTVIRTNLLLGGGFLRVGPTGMNGVREGYAHVTGTVVHQVADCVWPILGKRLERSVFAESPGGNDMPGTDEELARRRFIALGRFCGGAPHRHDNLSRCALPPSP